MRLPRCGNTPTHSRSRLLSKLLDAMNLTKDRDLIMRIKEDLNDKRDRAI